MDTLVTLNHLKNFEGEYAGKSGFPIEEEEDSFPDLEEAIPFVACGEVSDLDPDVNYSLKTNPLTGKEEKKTDYSYLEPKQKPINPPYQQFVQKKQNN